MQSISQNGYSEAEILDVLRGKDGTRELSFRYDLLNNDHTLNQALTNVLSASVSYNSLADIKRVAKFLVSEDLDAPIDYLSHRIKPYVRIDLPSSSGTYDQAIAAMPALMARWRLDETAIGTAADASGKGRTLTIPAGTSVNQSPLVQDGGKSVLLDSSHSITGATDWLNGLDRVTLLMWVSPTSITQQGILKTTGTTNNGLTIDLKSVSDIASLYTNVVCIKMEVGSNVVHVESMPNVLVAGQANSILFTWQSGVGSRLIINGNDVMNPLSPTPDAVGPMIDQTTITIGSGSVATHFAGKVDDVSFFDVFLDEDPAYNVYQAGQQIGRYGSNNYAEWPQGVFIMSTPTRAIDEGYSLTRQIDAYDLLQLLTDDKVSARYFVGGAANVTDAIDELFTNTTGIPVGTWDIVHSVSVTPTLGYDWPPGTPKITIFNDLLASINYQSLWFDENGRAQVMPYVLPQNRISEFDYSTDANSVTFPSATQTFDLYKVPNRWTIVVSDPDKGVLVSTYTNIDPTSPLSTVTRGRVILDFRTEQTAVNQTSLDGQVMQLAADAMSVFETIDFKTAIMPFHSDTDTYTINYDQLGAADVYCETKWDMPLKAGAQMSHSARKQVTLT
jgi:hypothetical protein